LRKISENDIESLGDPQLLLILPLWRL